MRGFVLLEALFENCNREIKLVPRQRQTDAALVTDLNLEFLLGGWIAWQLFVQCMERSVFFAFIEKLFAQAKGLLI